MCCNTMSLGYSEESVDDKVALQRIVSCQLFTKLNCCSVQY